MPFHTLIQKVTVDASANYGDHETLFDFVEIQLPAKDVVVLGGYFIVHGGDELASDNCSIHFYQNNTNIPGAASEATGLNAARIKANGYLGGCSFGFSEVDQGTFGFTNPTDAIHYDMTMLGNTGSSADEPPLLGNLVLTSNNIGNTVFAHGQIDVDTSGNFDATDSCRFILYLKY
tara:strand:+ start:1365 stop:1892 length:528 start_codon:yes stop_codon:yes gene_type:complete